LGQVDYAAAASALGAKAWRVDTIEDFAQAFALATATEGPTVVEALSSPSASPTLRVRDLLNAARAAGNADDSADDSTSTRQSAYFG
jgi:thiamine pyrophosphate-dependent acetolactate synthase large subunit-like protein